ncbi:MAG: dienelactone hydrolase family protein [Lentisphaeria bacterium]|jgi:predicted esterase|nr:dienelactone hydrolase family protein [Lentisphaeria bacterium]
MTRQSAARPVSQRLSTPPYADFGADEGLVPIVPAGEGLSSGRWEELRARFRSLWDGVLGQAELAPFDRAPQVVRRFRLPEGDAVEVLLPTTATSKQRVLLMVPRGRGGERLPGAVVPFYNPDRMAGFNLDTGEPTGDAPSVHFGRHLVQLGFVVVCGQAFPFNTVADPGTGAPFAHWHAAAAKLREEYPRWTGMARLVHDTRIALDFLLDQPRIDPERILVMGHSLGGKMAFYTGCLDARVKAIIASDFGMAFASTNWDAPWYLGPQIHGADFPVAHHQLLALAAPTPFLILAGECDGPRSWQYLDAARPVYELYGRGDALAILDHASGHRPPAKAVRTAYQWLGEQFGLSLGDCTI